MTTLKEFKNAISSSQTLKNIDADIPGKINEILEKEKEINPKLNSELKRFFDTV